MEEFVHFLTPYEFSPTIAGGALLSLVLFGRGAARLREQGRSVGFWRSLAFVVGVLSMYVVMQTQYDYWSQHMFFIHRVQHLVLHHLGPFLVALAVPIEVLGAGLPDRVASGIQRVALSPPFAPLRWMFHQPVLQAVVFVGLIYLWLSPELHFYAMLNIPLYNLMNWSMAIDGLIFWLFMLDPRDPRQAGTLGYGGRVLLLIAIVIPQILIGAYLGFSQESLYDVYAVCGRLWPLDPVTDQQIGGLTTWIPASMMSVLGLLVVIRRSAQTDRARESAAHPNAKLQASGGTA
ncbi:MAG: cytochrome c oxidase assembly protein [Pseudomonadota bacterium]|nr:cytochrome c oxidase assembly protein [Pseudomonadota bacterium]